MKRSGVAVVVALALLARPAAAQEVHGTVRDSASGAPIPGVVLVARDSAGNAVSRNITGDMGQYRFPWRGGMRRMQVLRIGFRPREVDIPAPANGVAQVDVTMALIKTLLDPVKVLAGSTCPRRADRAAAFALLDQARAGLLATVVAREANPAAVTRLAFERILDANGDRPVRQRVRLSTADRATVSFNAAHTAIDFVRRGFMEETSGRQTFFGPDADVLLDDGFARGYCFHLADPDTARPRQVGLAFTPADRRRDRVDIVGALWVDTASRTLVDIDFRYRGLSPLAEGLGSGGRISFREVSPSVVLIDRWWLRLVGAADTAVMGRGGAALHQGYVVREVGGELARASWPDGRAWRASLGTLRLSAATHAGALAPGTVVGLEDTDYQAVADSAGVAELPDLVPGPYAVIVLDRQLAPLGIVLPTPLTFVAQRDSAVRLRLDVPTAEEYVAAACRADGRVNNQPGAAWLFAGAATPDGMPVSGAQWRLSKLAGTGWTMVADGGITGSSGLLHLCTNLAIGETAKLEVWRKGEPAEVVVRRLAERVTTIGVPLQTVLASRERDASHPSFVLAGLVTDSVSGAGVPSANVELLGTLLEGVTDSAGRFAIPGVQRGDYTVRVRTPSLDSLGAVHQSPLVVSDPGTVVRLHVPTASQIASALCGAGRAGPLPEGMDGIVVGRVEMHGDSEPPRNVRVVAEWELAQAGADGARAAGAASAARRVRWIKVRADARGTYRLCGVPVDVAIVLRTEVDSGVNVGSAPVEVRIARGQQFARADLGLEPRAGASAVFAGFVVADSTAVPLADAEVTLTDLSRSALTNDQGGFRLHDIPAGTHKVLVRRLGYAAVTAQVSFPANQTVDHRIALSRASTLAAVEVNESAAPASFEQNRKLGLGRFLTRADLARNEGRMMADVLSTVTALNVARGRSGRAWVLGKRAPAKLPPRVFGAIDTPKAACNDAKSMSEECKFTKDDLRQQGLYCPEGTLEESEGIECGCYALIYVDGHLMNTQRPTEPWDINSIAPERIEGVEWYASGAQTPAQYATLNSSCGVMAIWTRRSHHH